MVSGVADLFPAEYGDWAPSSRETESLEYSDIESSSFKLWNEPLGEPTSTVFNILVKAVHKTINLFKI